MSKLTEKEFQEQLSAYRGYLIALHTINAVKKLYHTSHHSARPRASIAERAGSLALRESFLSQIGQYLEEGIEPWQEEHYELCLLSLKQCTWSANTGKNFHMEVSHKGTESYKRRFAVSYAMRQLHSSAMQLKAFMKPYCTPDYQSLGYAKAAVIFTLPPSDELLQDAEVLVNMVYKMLFGE